MPLGQPGGRVELPIYLQRQEEIPLHPQLQHYQVVVPVALAEGQPGILVLVVTGGMEDLMEVMELLSMLVEAVDKVPQQKLGEMVLYMPEVEADLV